MKTAFAKVGAAPHPFSLEEKGIKMEGHLRKKSMHRIELSAQITGSIDLDCDRCGRPYHQDLDEPLVLQITDEISQDKEDLDIIEFLDGVIDVTYIFESETNALAGDYHFCPQCAMSDEPIEIEF
jgi:hypothetical protein